MSADIRLLSSKMSRFLLIVLFVSLGSVVSTAVAQEIQDDPNRPADQLNPSDGRSNPARKRSALTVMLGLGVMNPASRTVRQSR